MDHQKIPDGASHYSVVYDTISYWRKMIYTYGIESGEPFYAWFWWNGKRWQKESYVNTLKLIPLDEKSKLQVC